MLTTDTKLTTYVCIYMYIYIYLCHLQWLKKCLKSGMILHYYSFMLSNYLIFQNEVRVRLFVTVDEPLRRLIKMAALVVNS